MKEFASLCRWCRRNLIVDVIKFSLDLQPRYSVDNRRVRHNAANGNGTVLLFVDIVQVNWPLLGRCRRSSPGSDSTMSHIMLNPLPPPFPSSSFPLDSYHGSLNMCIHIYILTRPRFPSFNSRIEREPSLLYANLVLYSWNLSGPRIGKVARRPSLSQGVELPDDFFRRNLNMKLEKEMFRGGNK